MCLLQKPLGSAAVAGFLILTAGLWVIWDGVGRLHWKMVVLVSSNKEREGQGPQSEQTEVSALLFAGSLQRAGTPQWESGATQRDHGWGPSALGSSSWGTVT